MASSAPPLSSSLADHIDSLRRDGHVALAAEISNLVDDAVDEAQKKSPFFAIPEIGLKSLKLGLITRRTWARAFIFVCLFLVFGLLYQTFSAVVQNSSAVIGWIPKLLRSEHLQNAVMIGVSENPRFYLELSRHYQDNGKLDRAYAMAILGLKMAGDGKSQVKIELEEQLDRLK